MPFNRDAIKEGLFQQIAADAEAKGLIKLSTAEEREASWRSLLAENPNADGAVWVFAYGSLLWNPAIHVEQTVNARLEGYHRDFTLRTYIGRGSEQQPGLVLGLEDGLFCEGQALKIPAKKVESELSLLWAREMVSSAYIPTWLPMLTDQAEPFYGIGFIMDKSYPHYAANLSFEQRCHDLAFGEGSLGRAADYLFDTLTSLTEMGIEDALLERYAERVKQLIAEHLALPKAD
ncbi:gamma-glutamylcyclotransferase [Reinekea thalattae]|nr:gamma-glutamylcyclotransferase [Reinekea thalattae]